MRALSFGFCAAFLLSLGLTPWVRLLALRLGALDPFSARKVLSPRATVPRLGGLGIAAAFYTAFLFLLLSQSTLALAVVADGERATALLLGGVPILVLGGIDDLRGTTARTKLLVQVLVAAGLWYAGLRIGGVTTLWEHFHPPQLLSFALTLLWIVGVINAVNLIDGLDGLASGVAFFALLSTFAISILRGDLLLALLSAALAGAVLGFLLFNWNPASIFMGDAGSMFLGYVLATTSIWTVQKAVTAVLVIFPAVALGLPLLDTSLTISRRLLSGRPVMQADRDHVHHRLLGRGLSHRHAVVLLYGVCAVFSGLAVAMVCMDRSASRLLLLLAACFALMLAYVLGYIRRGPEGIFHGRERRARNRALQQRLAALAPLLCEAQDHADLAAAVAEFGRAMGTIDLRLRLPGERGSGTPAATCYLIHGEGRDLGRVESPVAESSISPDDRVLMQLLCDALISPLSRLSGRAISASGAAPARTTWQLQPGGSGSAT